MTATAPSQGGDATSPQTSPDDYAGEEMTLFEHLNELRSRLFKSAVAIVGGFVVGFIFREPVLDILRQPYCNLPDTLRTNIGSQGADCTLVILRPLDAFFISVKAAAVVAVVVAAPTVSYQIWRFVTPGLRPIERRYAVPFILASQVLFVGGAWLSYLLIPKALQLLLQFAGEGITPVLSASEYLSFVLQTMIAFGAAFEFPLILIMLVLMGVVGVDGLRSSRRVAYFGTFVASAVITPTGDPVTMSVLALPLIVFYEVTIVVAKVVAGRRARALARM